MRVAASILKVPGQVALPPTGLTSRGRGSLASRWRILGVPHVNQRKEILSGMLEENGDLKLLSRNM